MTTSNEIGDVQMRLARAINEIRKAQAFSLTLPIEVDDEAVPVLSRSLADARHALSAACYTLYALGRSIEEQAP